MPQLQLHRLKESDPNISDLAKLREDLDEQGYLFFPGALDVKKVLGARDALVRVLQQNKLADEVTPSGPRFSGALSQNDPRQEQDGPMFRRAYGLRPFRELRDSSELSRILKRLYGAPVTMWRQFNIRVNLPMSMADAGPAGKSSVHQDLWYYRHYENFYTCWVPLFDIDEKVGGVAIAPGTHKNGLITNVFKDGKLLGIEESAVPDAKWFNADYRPGDFLTFPSTLVHRSLANRSDVTRLSVDYRYSPKGAKLDWSANYRTPYVIEFIKKAYALVKESGATGQTYDEALQRIIWKGEFKGRVRNLTLRNVKRVVGSIENNPNNS